jgi:hypothetical protein
MGGWCGSRLLSAAMMENRVVWSAESVMLLCSVEFDAGVNTRSAIIERSSHLRGDMSR